MKIMFDEKKNAEAYNLLFQSVIAQSCALKLEPSDHINKIVVVIAVAVSEQQMLDCLIKCSLANLMPLTAALIDVKMYIFRRRRKEIKKNGTSRINFFL